MYRNPEALSVRAQGSQAGAERKAAGRRPRQAAWRIFAQSYGLGPVAVDVKRDREALK